MNADANVVLLDKVAKRFGETRALADAKLLARPGEIHAVVGENGSGKSTLSKVLSGVVMPDSGKVSIFGATPSSPREAIAAGVATIYQEVLLAEGMTVLENLFAGRDGAWRRRESPQAKRGLAAGLLDRLVGAPVPPDVPVRGLPLSIKQWIVIARALLARPRLLIVDESSAALDLDATARLHREMDRLRAEGCCILLVTHRIAELVKVADAATILRDGVTVGRLERSEITEARLLELMTATSMKSGARVHAARPRTARPVLSARQVTLSPGATPIDFSVAPGEIVGLAGLDGAGHDVFVKMLAGITPPAAGEITAHGDPVRRITRLTDAARAGVAYVSGDRRREGIFPKLSIIDNFGMGLLDRHARPRALIDTAQRAQDFAVETKRLSIKLGRPSDRITTLSGGNQQKVLIGRAFAQHPKIIVLNDPARGVDIGTKNDLYRHLRQFSAEGGAVVYLSSEIEEFFGFVDRVDVFFAGAVFARLSGDEIDEHHVLTAMFGQTGPTSNTAFGAAHERTA